MPIGRPYLFIIHFERIQYVVNAEKGSSMWKLSYIYSTIIFSTGKNGESYLYYGNVFIDKFEASL